MSQRNYRKLCHRRLITDIEKLKGLREMKRERESTHPHLGSTVAPLLLFKALWENLDVSVLLAYTSCNSLRIEWDAILTGTQNRAFLLKKKKMGTHHPCAACPQPKETDFSWTIGSYWGLTALVWFPFGSYDAWDLGVSFTLMGSSWDRWKIGTQQKPYAVKTAVCPRG